MVHLVQEIKETKDKVIGYKQTLRALQQNRVSCVYVANDIDEYLTRKIQEACREKQITLIPVNLSQRELGKLCQIEVGAAVVALIK